MISVENHQEICKNPFLNSAPPVSSQQQQDPFVGGVAGRSCLASESICHRIIGRQHAQPHLLLAHLHRPHTALCLNKSPRCHFPQHNLRPVKVASVCHFPPSSVLRKAEFYIYILRCVSPVKSLGNTVTNYQALHSRATHVDWKINAMYDFCFVDQL